MSTTTTTAVVPSFYTFFFKYVDPVIALYGVYLNFAAPELAVRSMAPRSRFDPDTVFLFHQAGGLALAVAVLSALIPRCSRDLAVWRIVQWSLLLSDFAGLSGVYHALERQGRLATPAAWTADDKGCGGTYVLITLVRLAFVSGVGFGRSGGGSGAAAAKRR